MFKTYTAIMAGGALGSALRFWLATLVDARFAGAFPTGTLLVNVLGCALIGFFAALTAANGAWPAPEIIRQFVMIGILGGFTTFSAFSLQTLTLLHSGYVTQAGLYVLLSVLICLLAVATGYWATGLIPVIR